MPTWGLPPCPGARGWGVQHGHLEIPARLGQRLGRRSEGALRAHHGRPPRPRHAAGGAALDQPRGTWVQGSCGSFNFVFRFNLVNVCVLLVSEGRSGPHRLHVTPGAHDILCPPQHLSPVTPSPSAKARGSLTTIPPAPVASRRWPS